MQIKDLMTKSVLSCRSDDSLERAAQLMWEGDVGAVLVLDGNGGVIGIITDRDICMAAYTQGCGLCACSVGSAMSRDVETCTPSDSVALVEERMRRRQVRRVPVVDAGRLVGIVSLNDMALAAGNRKRSKSGQVSQEEIATTLARICEHREPGSLVAQ